jgi:hypothetical protein
MHNHHCQNFNTCRFDLKRGKDGERSGGIESTKSGGIGGLIRGIFVQLTGVFAFGKPIQKGIAGINDAKVRGRSAVGKTTTG